MKIVTKCPICMIERCFDVLKKYNNYAFHFCRTCDIIFSHPRKNPGNEWYENSPIHSVISNFLTGQVFWYHKQFLNDTTRYGKTLLDVGCGIGSFLNLAKDKYMRFGVSILTGKVFK